LRTHPKNRCRNPAVKNPPITLRRATPRDIKAMVAIISRTFSKDDAATAKGEIATVMKGASCEHFFIVAFINKTMVGLAGLVQSWLDFNAYEILWVGVAPELQGHGIGALLIGNIIKRAKTIKGHHTVRTILLSTEAIKFFKKCGFKSIAPLATGGDLMIMNLDKKR
jgi:N-acetylglutamate synthase-like GNAT family acetyltransferase